MPLIRVLLADDHRLFRQGLRQICEIKGGFLVVGEAENGEQAVRLARQLEPDVILMDIRMPLMNGLEALLLIRQENPAARIIILSMYPQNQKERAASGFGANAYLTKVIDVQELVRTVRAVHRGETFPNPARESEV